MKFCSQCGKPSEDDSSFCPGCGAKLEQGLQPAFAAPPPPAESNTSLVWMILNIVATVLCCFGFIFTGIGIGFGAAGNGSYGSGNYEAARKRSMVSMIMFIVGVLVGLAAWFCIFAAVLLNGFGAG